MTFMHEADVPSLGSIEFLLKNTNQNQLQNKLSFLGKNYFIATLHRTEKSNIMGNAMKTAVKIV